MTRLDSIRQNLIELRVQHGFSQEQLARLIGVKQATISRIENGRNVLSLDLLFKLLKVYKIDLVLVKKESKKC